MRRIAVGVVVCGLGLSAHAQIVTFGYWQGGHGNWLVTLDDANDWLYLPPPVPGLDFFLYPNNSLARNFIVSSSPLGSSGSNSRIRLRTLTPFDPLTINSMEVHPTDTLEVEDSTLQLTLAGRITNNGTISLDDGRIVTTVLLPGLLILDGAGQLRMTGESAIGSLLGAVEIADQNISGRGMLTGTSLSIDAPITADIAGETLAIKPSLTADLDGLFRALPGAKLEVSSAIGRSATADFSGEAIAAGGVVEIRDLTEFRNTGVLRSTSGGALQLKDVALRNNTLISIDDGVLNLRGNTTITGGTLTAAAAGRIVNAEGINDLAGNMTISGLVQVPAGELDFEPGVYQTAAMRLDTTTRANLHNATFIGGTIAGSGRAFIRASSTLDASTEAILFDGGTAYIPGTRALTARGELRFAAGGRVLVEDQDLGLGTGDAHLIIDGTVRLRNAGEGGGGIYAGVATHEYHVNRIIPANGGLLDIGAGTTVAAAGLGHRMWLNLPILNAGDIRASSDGLLYIEPATIANTGSMGASTNGRLHLSSGVTIQNSGGIVLADSGGEVLLNSFGAPGVTTVVGGSLTGTGRIRNSGQTVFNGHTEPVQINSTEVYLPGNTRLTLQGTIENNGRIFMSDQILGFGTINSILRADGVVTINGAGRIDLDIVNHSNNNNEFEAINNGAFIFGQDQLVTTVPGGIGAFFAPFTNHGVMRADGGTITTWATSITNTGAIEATNGGTFHLGNTNQSTTVENTAGVLRARANSTIVTTGWITGGRLEGAGRFRNNSQTTLNAVAEPMTLQDAELYLPGNTRLTIRGELINNGRIFMSDQILGFGTINSILRADGPVAISGIGQIVLDSVNHPNNNHEFEQINGGSFDFGVGQLITTVPGPAGVGYFLADSTNRGTIRADGGHIQFAGADVRNHGTLSAINGGRLAFGTNGLSLIDSTGGGILHAGPGSWMEAHNAHLRHGRFEGGGELRIALNSAIEGTSSPFVIADSTLVIQTGSFSTAADIYGTLTLDNGAITLQDHAFSTGVFPRLRPGSATTTIDGTGTIRFLPAAGQQNLIEAIGSATLTLGSGITVETGPAGYGTIATPITSSGLIHARDGGTIQLQNLALTNRGELRASGASTILFPIIAGTTQFDNAGGRITVESGSLVTLSSAGVSRNAAVITGGLIDGSGEIRNEGIAYFVSTAQAPMSMGAVRIKGRGSTDTVFRGNLTLAGTRLTPADDRAGFGTYPSYFHAEGSVFLDGYGAVEFGNNGFQVENVLNAAAGSSWNLGSGVDIRVPAGAIGELRGTINAAGAIDVNADLFITSGTTTILPGGKLTGGGTVHISSPGALVNAGSVKPGNSPGRLTINGNLVNTAGANIELELAGMAAGQFDVLEVRGRITLAGSLDIALLNGYIPSQTQSFLLISATNGFAGSFDNLIVDGGVSRLRTDDGWYDITFAGSQMRAGNFIYDPIPAPGALAVVVMGIGLAWRRKR